MTLQQGPIGGIEFFSDFAGPEFPLTDATAGPRNFHPFVVVGDGLDETDAGVVAQTTLLGGVVQLTTTDEDNHACYMATELMLDPALMSPLVVEARVQMAAITIGRIFVGFTNDCCDNDVATVCEANSGTVTNTMTNFVGLYFDSGATLSSTWLYSYKGGTTAASTTEQTTGKTIAAGEWDVARVEVFNNGDSRMYINGELVATVAGAIATGTDVGMLCGVGSTSDTAVSSVDLDYLYVSAARDWTV